MSVECLDGNIKGLTQLADKMCQNDVTKVDPTCWLMSQEPTLVADTMSSHVGRQCCVMKKTDQHAATRVTLSRVCLYQLTPANTT